MSEKKKHVYIVVSWGSNWPKSNEGLELIRKKDQFVGWVEIKMVSKGNYKYLKNILGGRG